MLSTLFLSALLFFHPVHVTLTSMDYTPGTRVFKVFVKMYCDDFLRDCKVNGEQVENVVFSDKDSASFSLMEKYLSKKVKVEVNDKKLVGKLQNMTLNDNEISVNLQYGKVKKPAIVSVTNLIMTSLYSDQANMLIIRVNDFEEGVRLTPEATEKTFRLK